MPFSFYLSHYEVNFNRTCLERRWTFPHWMECKIRWARSTLECQSKHFQKSNPPENQKEHWQNSKIMVDLLNTIYARGDWNGIFKILKKNLNIEFYIQWKYPSDWWNKKLFQINEYWVNLLPTDNWNIFIIKI